jgi:hypothetical protein
MHLRTRLLASVVVSAMVVGFGGTVASADTLFTTVSHATPVGVGTTASLGSGTVTAIRDGTVVNTCASSTLQLEITQNDEAALSGTFTSGTFSGCFLSAAGDFPWRFTVRGSGVLAKTTTTFNTTTWSNVFATLWGVSPGSGTLTDSAFQDGVGGASLRENPHNGSSICFTLNKAGTLSGPLLTDGKIDANYCLEGATATAWSRGPTAIPAASTTLFTTPSHSTRVTVGATARLTAQGTIAFTTFGTSVVNCLDSTLTFRLTANTDAGGVQGTVTSGTLGSCPGPFGLTTTATAFPWKLSITGSTLVIGATTAYPNARLTNMTIDFSDATTGSVFTGDLTSAGATLTGLYAAQPTTGTAPICLIAANAGDVLGPGDNDLTQMDARYCIQGEPASTWSLT